MLDRLKLLFGKKQRKPKFTLEQYRQHDELKQKGLGRVLGKMHGIVNHSLIPF